MTDVNAKPLAVPPSEVPRAAGVLPRIPTWVAGLVFTVAVAADICAHVITSLAFLGPSVNAAAIPLATAALGATGMAPLANLLTGVLTQHGAQLTTVADRVNGGLDKRLADQTLTILAAVDAKFEAARVNTASVASHLAAGDSVAPLVVYTAVTAAPVAPALPVAPPTVSGA